MYLRPKDSNGVVGVRDRAAQKAPEGYGRQTTNKQSNKLSAYYSQISPSGSLYCLVLHKEKCFCYRFIIISLNFG